MASPESFSCGCFSIGLVVFAEPGSQVRMRLVDFHHLDACIKQEPRDACRM